MAQRNHRTPRAKIPVEKARNQAGSGSGPPPTKPAANSSSGSKASVRCVLIYSLKLVD